LKKKDRSSDGKKRKKIFQLLHDFKEMTGYWKLKEVELDRKPWRTCFGRGYRPVVQLTMGIRR
jgi:hypothetical protein